MNTLNFYKKDGNLYIFKNQPVFISILSLFFIVIAILTFKDVRILSFVLIALVVLIVINFFAKKFIIDMDRQTVTGKHSIFVPAQTYPIQDFANFEVVATKYWGLITTNVMLSIHFYVDGKKKRLTIGQALTHKGIQKMVNETEDIMNINQEGNERNRPL
ncbi:hypothetical protein C1637_08150 [Chryseobacterium lactis]|uniref:PH domain-containing protein n=1 Tax=Chryseobacterium lactis TaxID=1241981 RepID=A0A3G6RG94_CHRLC|nr:hypothetical protein [Chryseobacterium lactis]AZA82491.1 hypothetical protein EG342_11545 [Chryseobacterium lactis]AZB02873.1 hypothetical protein EG341_02405 [Chryseobacterium lactis]PNW13833.1 hypothetical protein C1637_08150 [Chryseobacterium lactis]